MENQIKLKWKLNKIELNWNSQFPTRRADKKDKLNLRRMRKCHLNVWGVLRFGAERFWLVRWSERCESIWFESKYNLFVWKLIKVRSVTFALHSYLIGWAISVWHPLSKWKSDCLKPKKQTESRLWFREKAFPTKSYLEKHWSNYFAKGCNQISNRFHFKPCKHFHTKKKRRSGSMKCVRRNPMR